MMRRRASSNDAELEREHALDRDDVDALEVDLVKKSLKLAFAAVGVTNRTELAARYGHCLLR